MDVEVLSEKTNPNANTAKEPKQTPSNETEAQKFERMKAESFKFLGFDQNAVAKAKAIGLNLDNLGIFVHTTLTRMERLEQGVAKIVPEIKDMLQNRPSAPVLGSGLPTAPNPATSKSGLAEIAELLKPLLGTPAQPQGLESMFAVIGRESISKSLAWGSVLQEFAMKGMGQSFQKMYKERFDELNEKLAKGKIQ